MEVNRCRRDPSRDRAYPAVGRARSPTGVNPGGKHFEGAYLLDLNATFSDFSCFRIRRAEDELALHELLETVPMRVGGMELVYDRRPSFSAQLGYQAARHVTGVAETDGKLRGSVSFSWGRRLVNGNEVHAAYIGDFRMRADRQALRAWRTCYPRLLELLGNDREFGPCEWVHTAILRGNSAARRSLVELGPRKGFHYHHLAEVAMVNVLLPCRDRRGERLLESRGLHLSMGDSIGAERIREFLIRTNQRLLLGYDFSASPGNEWDRRVGSWPGFDFRDFLVVTDHRGEIAATTLPWAPDSGKRMLVRKVSSAASLFHPMLRTFGIHVPREGEPFRTLYLTHLCFSDELEPLLRAAAIRAFLERTYRLPGIQAYAMVSYADHQGLRSIPPLRSVWAQVTEVDLYRVSTSASQVVLPPHTGLAFEMALV